MKHRAIKNLIQLNKVDFIKEISNGLEELYKSCVGLRESYKLLASNGDFRGANIIKYIAKEEAAKFLILIDAVRCPDKEQKLLSRQLEKFNEHLAKGVYAELTCWKPSTYNELCGYIDNSLEQYYLDGPSGVDWIFRNQIVSRREEAMYVDYVQYTEKDHMWLTPIKDNDFNFTETIVAVEMVEALYNFGISNYEALNIFSKYWKEFEFDGDTHYKKFKEANLESFKTLDEKGLLKETSDKIYSFIICELPFPLYKEEFKEKKIPLQKLREEQDNWYPEW